MLEDYISDFSDELTIEEISDDSESIQVFVDEFNEMCMEADDD